MFSSTLTTQRGRTFHSARQPSPTNAGPAGDELAPSGFHVAVIMDGNPLSLNNFQPRIQSELAEKQREEDRVVVVKSSKDTPYHQWIKVTDVIEQAGGIITLQIEEERTVVTH